MSRKTRDETGFLNHYDPVTLVPHNKLGIKDPVEFELTEAAIANLAMIDRPKFEQFSLQEMQKIHGHIFSEVYEWAGEIRTYQTGRASGPFCPPEFIENYFLKEVQEKLTKENMLQGTSADDFADRAGFYLSEVNAIHPFVDGNGRITRIFLEDLAEKANHPIDLTKIENRKDDWHRAAAISHTSADHSHLTVMIRQAMLERENTMSKVTIILGEDSKAQAEALAQKTGALIYRENPPVEALKDAEKRQEFNLARQAMLKEGRDLVYAIDLEKSRDSNGAITKRLEEFAGKRIEVINDHGERPANITQAETGVSTSLKRIESAIAAIETLKSKADSYQLTPKAEAQMQLNFQNPEAVKAMHNYRTSIAQENSQYSGKIIGQENQMLIMRTQDDKVILHDKSKIANFDEKIIGKDVTINYSGKVGIAKDASPDKANEPKAHEANKSGKDEKGR